MFYDNYVRLCNKANKSPSAVAEEIGFKRSVVTAWKNGRSPREATLLRIADYFGCSIAELLTETEKTAPEKSEAVSESDMKLIEWFRSLPPEKQRAILTAQDAPEGIV